MEATMEQLIETPVIEYGNNFLEAEWCECLNPDLLWVAEEGTCPCGAWKRHAHCKCGKIMQIG